LFSSWAVGKDSTGSTGLLISDTAGAGFERDSSGATGVDPDRRGFAVLETSGIIITGAVSVSCRPFSFSSGRASEGLVFFLLQQNQKSSPEAIRANINATTPSAMASVVFRLLPVSVVVI
jgi:hypothetical protein